MSVICGDTEARLTESSQLFGGPFDIGIFGPSLCRQAEVVSKLLKRLGSGRKSDKDAVVVYEHSHKSDSTLLIILSFLRVSVMVFSS